MIRIMRFRAAPGAVVRVSGLGSMFLRMYTVGPSTWLLKLKRLITESRDEAGIKSVTLMIINKCLWVLEIWKNGASFGAYFSI